MKSLFGKRMESERIQIISDCGEMVEARAVLREMSRECFFFARGTVRDLRGVMDGLIVFRVKTDQLGKKNLFFIQN